MQIAPGVHQIRMLGADAFVIAEERLTLIDAGMLGSRLMLERALRGLGRDAEELERVICTHGHLDHIGGVRQLLRGRPDVELLIHPADLAEIRRPWHQVIRRRPAGGRRGELLHLLTPAPIRATPVEDGDLVPVLGGLRVVHTPGHTPGSICLYAARERLLFTGDVLQVTAGRLTYAHPFYSHDHAAARRSVARLAELDVGAIALSHYPPWRDQPTATLRALADGSDPRSA